MPAPRRPLPAAVGVLLSRLLVPLWVLTGASFKAYFATPANLPPTLFRPANEAGVDLLVLLWVIVALELLAVGVMFFLPRLARAMAIFMLVCFCIVLIGEMATGNFTSCGCLGDLKFPPWAMLLVDGGMLLGILLSRRPDPAPPATSVARWATAGVWTAAGVAISAAMILPAGRAPEPVTPPGGTTVDGGRTPRPLDPYYVANCDDWVGKRWDEIDLAQYMLQWPEDVDQGQQYVIFYGRTCEQCEALFEMYFTSPPVPTTVVAVPEEKTGFADVEGHASLCQGCAELELPVGSDWVVTTPDRGGAGGRRRPVRHGGREPRRPVLPDLALTGRPRGSKAPPAGSPAALSTNPLQTSRNVWDGLPDGASLEAVWSARSGRSTAACSAASVSPVVTTARC